MQTYRENQINVYQNKISANIPMEVVNIIIDMTTTLIGLIQRLDCFIKLYIY